jgi:hypothetical protein
MVNSQTEVHMPVHPQTCKHNNSNYECVLYRKCCWCVSCLICTDHLISNEIRGWMVKKAAMTCNKIKEVPVLRMSLMNICIHEQRKLLLMLTFNNLVTSYVKNSCHSSKLLLAVKCSPYTSCMRTGKNPLSSVEHPKLWNQMVISMTNSCSVWFFSTLFHFQHYDNTAFYGLKKLHSDCWVEKKKIHE